MPTIPFCSLDDVYADWNFKKPNQVPQLRKFGEPEPGHEPDHKPIIQRQQKVVQHGNNETDILTFLLQALQLSLTIETQFIQSQRCAKQMKRKRVPPQIKERMRELKHTIE